MANAILPLYRIVDYFYEDLKSAPSIEPYIKNERIFSSVFHI